MANPLNQRSLSAMKGVHPDLVKVAHRAAELSPIDFIVTEGLRTKARQTELMSRGLTRTMNSRHLTGHAIDVAAVVKGKIVWVIAPYTDIAKAFRQAGTELSVQLRWGGDFNGNGLPDDKFVDAVHFELARSQYP